MRESPDGCIRQVDGHLWVDLGAATEVAAVYRDVVVLSIEKQVRRILVKLGDDPLGERCLRTALTTIVLAGLPPEFRLALVAESARIEARYRITARDLRMAGVDAKIFETEDAAVRWLADSSFSARQRA